MELREPASRSRIALITVGVAMLVQAGDASAGRLDGQDCPFPAPISGNTPAVHDYLVTQFMALPVLDLPNSSPGAPISTGTSGGPCAVSGTWRSIGPSPP